MLAEGVVFVLIKRSNKLGEQQIPADLTNCVLNTLDRSAQQCAKSRLKRVHSVDALACPCGGRLKFVELITEPSTAREVLASMGLPIDLPPIAKARSPDFGQESFFADWD